MSEHKNEQNAWFEPKNIGIGSGWPIVWQGWALLGSHVLALVMLSLLLQKTPLLMIIVLFIAAFAPLPIYRAKTRGGWHWRSGTED